MILMRWTIAKESLTAGWLEIVHVSLLGSMRSPVAVFDADSSEGMWPSLRTNHSPFYL